MTPFPFKALCVAAAITAAPLLYGATSIVTTTMPGTITLPAVPPYTSIADQRVEARLSLMGPCNNISSGYGNNYFRVNVVGLGCTELNKKSLSMEFGGLPAPILATADALASVDEVVVRIQKVTATGTYVGEVWNAKTGTLLGSRNIKSSQAALVRSMAGYQALLTGTAGTGSPHIAWLRVYTSLVPAGSALPQDNGPCDTTGDCIAQWDFENTLVGKGSGGIDIPLTKKDATYVATPAYAIPLAPLSLVTSITPGTVTIPATPPYTSISDQRVEARLSLLGPCNSIHSGYGNNYFRFNVVGLGCTELNKKSLSMDFGGLPAPIIATEDALASVDEVVVRLQKDTASGNYVGEVWDARSGMVLGTRTVKSGQAPLVRSMAGYQAFLTGTAGAGSPHIAWIRAYTTLLPVGSTLPQDDGGCDTSRDCIGKWDFEHTLVGKGFGGIDIPITKNDTTYVATPAYSIPPAARPFEATSILTSTTPGTVTIPAIPPYTSISDQRVEARLSLLGPCNSMSSGYGNNFFRINVVGLGCTELNKKSLSMESGGLPAPIIATADALASVDEVVVRLQKDTASGNYVGEVWDAKSGMVLGTRTVKSGQALLVRSMAGYQALLTGTAGAGSPHIAWIRVYTSLLPVGSAVPPQDEGVCDTSRDCIGKWTFDKTLIGKGFGGITLAVTKTDATYVATPAYSIPLQSLTQPPPSTQASSFPGRVRELREPLYANNSWRRFGTYLLQNATHKIGSEEKSLASAKFFAPRLRQQIEGRSPAPFNPDVPINAKYIDAVNIYTWQTISLAHMVSDKYGFYHEDLWNHYDQNHSYRQDKVVGWTNMDSFDAFDNVNGGIYTSDGLTYTRRADTFALTGSHNTLLLGYTEPFDEVNLTLNNTPDATVIWSYWNGTAWMPLQVRSDTTNGFTRNGRMQFTPPADWKRLVLTPAHYKKWWVRAVFSGATVYPSIATLRTWNLHVGTNGFGNPIYPGWCRDSATRVNRGLSGDGRDLVYDPTPPAQCAARFRWQGRMLGVWAKNLQNCNTTNVQNGQYTCARMIAEYTTASFKSEGRNAGYLDDLFPPNTRDVAEPLNANSCIAGTSCPGAGLCGSDQLCHQRAIGELLSHTDTGFRGDYYSELTTHYQKYREYLQQTRSDAKITANTGDNRTRYAGDGWLNEMGTSTMGANDPVVNWDPHSRDNGNTNCSHMLVGISDTASELMLRDGWYYWDRGQRGPMTALGIYYSYANECIDAFYNISSVSWYAGSDSFRYWNDAPDGQIAVPLEPTPAGTTVLLAGTFTALPAGISDIRLGGTTGEVIRVTKVNDTSVTTTEEIFNSYPAGTKIWILRTGYLSEGGYPAVDHIYNWNAFFPAMEVDLGSPDVVNGIAGSVKGVPKPKGFRNNQWISSVDSGTKNGITRRDFTNAIIIYARADYADWSGGSNPVNHGLMTKAMASTYSNKFEIEQNGQRLTLYPLRVDGKTDTSMCDYGALGDYRDPVTGGCTAFRVRSGEALILMKRPVAD